jgi:hypothetical protein
MEYENVLIQGCAGLSILGGLLIVGSSCAFKLLDSYTFRLVTYLSLVDIFISSSTFHSGFLIPNSLSHELCLLQAMLQNYSQLASLFFTGLISYSLYEMIVKDNAYIIKQETYTVSICFLLPAIVTPLPLFTNSYGDAQGWCWITYDRTIINYFWTVFQFYGPLFILFLMNIYFYIRIYRKIRNEKERYDDLKVVVRMMKRLKLYPLILIVCFGPAVAHRIFYLITKDNEHEILNLVTACLLALYGAANTVVYGMTGKVRKSLRLALKRCFSCKDPSVSKNLLEKDSKSEFS